MIFTWFNKRCHWTMRKSGFNHEKQRWIEPPSKKLELNTWNIILNTQCIEQQFIICQLFSWPGSQDVWRCPERLWPWQAVVFGPRSLGANGGGKSGAGANRLQFCGALEMVTGKVWYSGCYGICTTMVDNTYLDKRVIVGPSGLDGNDDGDGG